MIYDPTPAPFTLDDLAAPGAIPVGTEVPLRPIDHTVMLLLQEAGRRIIALEQELTQIKAKTDGLWANRNRYVPPERYA